MFVFAAAGVRFSPSRGLYSERLLYSVYAHTGFGVYDIPHLSHEYDQGTLTLTLSQAI
jgi:hypothetical protein